MLFRAKSRDFNLHFRAFWDYLNLLFRDFIITRKKIAQAEVKSGNYRSHSSLDKFRKHFSSVVGNSYILYTKDVMIKDGIIHLPLYMAELL